MRLPNRVAIVTGGASGIGAAIVCRFATEGARVAIFDRDMAGAQALARTLGDSAAAIKCDVSNEHDVAMAVEEVVRRYGAIHILVNNAGISPTISTIEDTAEGDWNAMLDVHAKGCFLCTKHAMRHMKQHDGGAIVNVSSLGGIRGRPLRHSYIAAKHAIVGLTKSTALEGLAHNIRVNAVAPGPVDTRRESAGVDAGDRAGRLAAHREAGGSEINFVILPEAVAAAVLFLASDEARNITGVVLPVDGGIMAGSPQRGRLRLPGQRSEDI